MAQTRRKLSGKYTPDKGLMFRIYKEFSNSTIKDNKNSVQHSNRNFTR